MSQPRSLFGSTNVVETPTTVIDSSPSGLNPLGNLPLVPTNAIVATTNYSPAVVQEAKQYDLTVVDEQQVVLFGSDRQRAIGSALDNLLAEITKENNPILFELFRKLQKGVEGVDVPALEKEIRESNEKGFVGGLLESIGLSSAAKRLEKANDKISAMLRSKSSSLLDLTKEMEGQIQVEVNKLIADSKKLNTLADEYRQNITYFSQAVEVGKLVLENAKAELARKQAHAATTNAQLDIEAVKLFSQKVDLFETRLVTIETILQKAPAELEAIRLAQGASLATLGETANSALEEFNDIKSVLMKLTIANQINTVQGLGSIRRDVRDKLQAHGTNLLGQVAVNAATAQGQNRVDDSKRLLEFTTKITDISKRVEAEKANNQNRFAEARANLLEVKKLISK